MSRGALPHARWWAVLACLMASACGSGPPLLPVEGGGGDPLLGRSALRLFISPSGQPFRGAPGAPYPVVVWFEKADTDQDGKLTQQEFRTDADAFFRDLDTNHDGVIDGAELQLYEQEVAPEILPHVGGLRAGEGLDSSLDLPGGGGRQSRREPRAGREEASDRRPDGAGLYGLLNEPEPVAASDGNFDGRITQAEFLTAADRRFASLDKKAAGYLTLAALPKTPVQIAGEKAAARRAKRQRP